MTEKNDEDNLACLKKFKAFLENDNTSKDMIHSVCEKDIKELIAEYKNAINPLNRNICKQKNLNNPNPQDPKLLKPKSSLTKVRVNPTVLCLIQTLTKNISDNEERIKLLQCEINQSKFTQDSQNGKRLMNRIRLLEHENEELLKSNNQTSKRLKTEQEINLRKEIAKKFLLANENLYKMLMVYENEAEKFTEILKNITEERRKQAKEIELLSKQADPEFLKQLFPNIPSDPKKPNEANDSPTPEERQNNEIEDEEEEDPIDDEMGYQSEADNFSPIEDEHQDMEQLDYEDDYQE